MHFIEIQKEGKYIGTVKTDLYSYQVAEYLKEFKPTTDKNFIDEFVWFVINKNPNDQCIIETFYVNDIIDITKL